MDTNFNAALYQEEMLSLVNTAIKKLKAEHPDYTVFTISLTTDFASGVSAVHFAAGPPRNGISRTKQSNTRNIFRPAI